MCRVLELSRSGYYAWRTRLPSARARQDKALQERIRAIHQKSRRRYGSPRIHAELQAQGVRCGRKRVSRLMRAAGLRAKSVRRHVRPRSEASAGPAPNRLQRRFGLAEVQASAQSIWVSDLTYVPTQEGWLYLAAVLNLGTRKVIGWAMQSTLESSLAVRALEMALQAYRGHGPVLHHSDRGVQYTSREYQALLARHQIECSMSRRGDCWDNAVAESFFATLEKELIQDSRFRTRREARSAIFEFIEIWYNRQRRHSSLGYCTPAEYEDRLALQKRAA